MAAPIPSYEIIRAYCDLLRSTYFTNVGWQIGNPGLDHRRISAAKGEVASVARKGD